MPRAPRCASGWAAIGLVAVLGGGCTSRGGGPGSSVAGTSTGASQATGSSSGTSSAGAGPGGTSGGSATGVIDAGCEHPGHVAELGACVLDADCLCPLSCLPDPAGNLLCQLGCRESSDCVGGETCDAGLCVVEAACDPVVGSTEFVPCAQVADCSCPLGCFGDGRLGRVCERPCHSEADCLDAGSFCETDAGSCQLATVGCDPGLTASSEFGSCTRDPDCRCPFACFDDPLRGLACERPCVSGADCGEAGETCAGGDAGRCELACTPGLPSAFAACQNSAQCPCPMSCELLPNSSTGLCLSCDAGACLPPPGLCVDAGLEAAASQTVLPPVLGSGDVVACSSNADCDCPNQCLPFESQGTVDFICQSPKTPCTSFEDCPDPAEACLFGACLPNDCPPSAQPGDRCDPSAGENAAFAGSGVCLYSPHASGLVCTQGGDAGAGCSANPDRRRAETLCPAGLICVDGDAGTFCAAACSDTCDAGNCSNLDPAPAPGCPGCGGLFACLPGTADCTDDLPSYLPDDGPFDEASVGVEYARCYGAPGCRCPLACVEDATLTDVQEPFDCERGCQSSADCPLPEASCLGGFCALDSAGCGVQADGGLELGAACDAGDGPGTCVYFSRIPIQRDQVFEPVAVCRADGTAKGACDPAASRGGAGLCGAGSDCLPLSDGGFGCQPLCAPLATPGDCAPGQGCFPLTNNPDGVNEGTCAALGDGGCALDVPSNELAQCASASDCACGFVCASAGTAGTACARPCSKVTDCAEDEVCFGEAGARVCELNLCGLKATTCDADEGADGSCVAATSVPQPHAFAAVAEGVQQLFGICEQAGSATGACDPAADRSAPSLRCVPGAICDTTGPVPTCTPLCIDPGQGELVPPAACGPTQYCVPLPVYTGLLASQYGPGIEGECLPALGVDAGT